MLVNHFETLVSQHMGLPSQICIYNEFCGKGIAVEHVAAFIPATIMFTPSIDWERCEKSRLRKWSSLQPKLSSATPSQKHYGATAVSVPYLKDCWGECPKNRLIRTPDGEAGLNYLCAGLKKFNKHALPEAEQIADEIRQQQNSRIPKAHDSWSGSSNAFIDHNGMPARRRK